MMCGGGGGGCGRSSKAALSPKKVVRRSPPPPIPPSSPEQKLEFLRNGSTAAAKAAAEAESVKNDESLCNEGQRESKDKVMVVVDSSVEAKSALEWALSRAVKSEDSILFLLYVCKSCHLCDDDKRQSSADDGDVLKGKLVKIYELLCSLKSF